MRRETMEEEGNRAERGWSLAKSMMAVTQAIGIATVIRRRERCALNSRRVERDQVIWG